MIENWVQDNTAGAQRREAEATRKQGPCSVPPTNPSAAAVAVGRGVPGRGDQRRDDEAAIVPRNDRYGRHFISVVSDAVIGVLSGG
jgi:hypothetical protein